MARKTDILKLYSYEKTMVGIIIDHFDDIARCGTANGARAKLIGGSREQGGKRYFAII